MAHRAKRIPEATWEEHRAAICRMYLDEMMRLEDVMKTMQEKHGFEATYEGPFCVSCRVAPLTGPRVSKRTAIHSSLQKMERQEARGRSFRRTIAFARRRASRYRQTDHCGGAGGLEAPKKRSKSVDQFKPWIQGYPAATKEGQVGWAIGGSRNGRRPGDPGSSKGGRLRGWHHRS